MSFDRDHLKKLEEMFLTPACAAEQEKKRREEFVKFLRPDSPETVQQSEGPNIMTGNKAAETLSDDDIECIAHHHAWCYSKSSDTHHSDTYTFNRAGLLAFVRALPLPAPEQAGVPDGVWEALQRLIENGELLGPASRDDALLVARYRDHVRFIAPPAPEPSHQQSAESETQATSRSTDAGQGARAERPEELLDAMVDAYDAVQSTKDRGRSQQEMGMQAALQVYLDSVEQPQEAVAQLRHLCDDIVVTYQENGLDRHMVGDGKGLLFSNMVAASKRLLAAPPAVAEPDAQLLIDIEANMREAWRTGALSADAWPTDLAKRLTRAIAERNKK